MTERADRLRQWARGETPGPWELVLFPTNRCNLRCAICWQRYVEEIGEVDYKSELSDQRLLDLVDEAAELGVRNWRFIGGGEPLVRDELVIALCEKIRARGMNGSIQTNGTRFTPESIQTLIRIGWDLILVSLDGPTAEINDTIRSKGSFERATKNLRLFSELKRAAGVKIPYVTVNMVVTKVNWDKIEDMLRLTHELGCDELTPIPLVVQGKQCAGFDLTEEQRAELPGLVRRAEDLARQLGMPGSFYNFVFSEEMTQAQCAHPERFGIVGDGRFSDAYCFEPWTVMAIKAEDGKAGPCCPFWEEKVDTLRDKSLKELWLGPYMQDIHKRILERKNLPWYCKNCCSDVPARTQRLREILESFNRPSLSEMGPLKAARFLSGRLAVNLKQRGLRQTLRRGKEWIQIHVGKK